MRCSSRQRDGEIPHRIQADLYIYIPIYVDQHSSSLVRTLPQKKKLASFFVFHRRLVHELVGSKVTNRIVWLNTADGSQQQGVVPFWALYHENPIMARPRIRKQSALR